MDARMSIQLYRDLERHMNAGDWAPGALPTIPGPVTVTMEGRVIGHAKSIRVTPIDAPTSHQHDETSDVSDRKDLP